MCKCEKCFKEATVIVQANTKKKWKIIQKVLGYNFDVKWKEIDKSFVETDDNSEVCAGVGVNINKEEYKPMLDYLKDEVIIVTWSEFVEEFSGI